MHSLSPDISFEFPAFPACLSVSVSIVSRSEDTRVLSTYMPIARARLKPLLMLHLLQMVMQVVQEALHAPAPFPHKVAFPTNASHHCLFGWI